MPLVSRIFPLADSQVMKVVRSVYYGVSCIGIVLVVLLLHVLKLHLLRMEVVRVVIGARVGSLVTVSSFASCVLIRRAESAKAMW